MDGRRLSGRIRCARRDEREIPACLGQTRLAAAPQAIVHRAFNSLGWENFAEPCIDGEQIAQFYCVPSGESQVVVEELIAAIGLRPIRVGGLETAEQVDAIGSLWVTLAIGQHRGRHMAFRLLGG